MSKKKKRKKYKLNARFYCWILGVLLMAAFIMNSKSLIPMNTIPNFHGWSAEEVMKYDERHDNISVIYELSYSYDVLQNCVMNQSIKPRTKMGDDPLILTLQISKGAPVMEDFVGKSLGELKEFAAHYELNLSSSQEEGTIESQSVLAGDTLTKGMIVEVKLTNE